MTNVSPTLYSSSFVNPQVRLLNCDASCISQPSYCHGSGTLDQWSRRRAYEILLFSEFSKDTISLSTLVKCE